MFLKKVTLLPERIQYHDQYPFSIPAIRNLDSITFKKPVTFFVGENGTGKSTLLEGIAANIGFNTAGGSRSNLYDVDKADAPLSDYLRLSWLPKISNGFFFRAETFYHFATYIDEVDDDGYQSYGGKSLHQQSHGESFLALFSNRFYKKAIYLLDEPEAALSPARQLTFLRVIHDLTKNRNVQLIIATHSPILLGYPDAQIVSFDEDQLREITYEMTDHYLITKYFLDNRGKMLDELLKEHD
ncbi:AAA family ATPase [Pradoshia sp.]|uniref:AAA family ATPase n=1 Tax=Pradoshia sp. TaxID=2651281 RepID=UPI003F0FDE5C